MNKEVKRSYNINKYKYWTYKNFKMSFNNSQSNSYNYGYTTSSKGPDYLGDPMR